MELLFIVIIAIAIGIGAHYILPGAETRGVLLIPSVSGAATSVVWVALVWLGWKFDGGWIWVVGVLVAFVLSLVLALTIPRGRRKRDSDLLYELSRA